MKPFILFALLLCSGCATLKKGEVSTAPQEVLIDESPRILFINYRITKEADREIKAELINMIIAGGTIKSTDEIKSSAVKGDMLCVQLDQNGLELKRMAIADPLIKHIEYVNKEGNLEIKTFELETTDLNLRLQLHPDTRFISLHRIKSPESTEELLKINL